MSSSARPGRVIRAAQNKDDVFLLGEDVRASVPTPAPLATAAEVLLAADARAAEIVASAEAQAAQLVAQATAEASAIREAAFNEGVEAGRAAAEQQVRDYLDVVRAAANEGKAVRDAIADQASALVARAVALATRRIVAEYYEADPARTALACAEALRAVSGQEVLALRVNPTVASAVKTALLDAAHYVQPDEGVEIGGCVIDLRHGTLDATLDARLSLMEIALTEAGGGDQ